MRVAILAGGRGTRLRASGEPRPKPLVPVGTDPIVWHVLRMFGAQGIRHSVLALGHRADEVARGVTDCAGCPAPPPDRSLRIPVAEWQGSATLVDTGDDTEPGGRIRRLLPHLRAEPFLLAWCDGLSDLDVARLVAFHRARGPLVTVVAVRPPSRFGHLTLEGDRVAAFVEKPEQVDCWVSGGIFMVEPTVAGHLHDDRTSWDRDVLPRLAADGALAAYRHHGFWRCLDDAHDRDALERLWAHGTAPWRMREAA
ncbi:MAG: sugar phosphate nucleotidyltransferase [Alphaproteobacteria bacterium]